MTTKIRRVGLVPLLLFACSLMGCERTTQVEIKGGTTPVFELSGSGAVAIFAVYSPDYITKAEKPFDENFALWEIKPSGGYLHGTWIRDLGSITYGVVPPDYMQVIPKVGTPPPLTEGQKYFYRVETTAAPWAAGYLEIRHSKAVPTDAEGPCFGRENNKWIRVACPKGF